MGSFSKMAIFLFCTIGLFAILFALTPPQFFLASYEATIGTDKAIAAKFDVANVTLYASMGSANMTYDWSSYHDHPSAPPPQHQAGLPSGQYLEIWWGSEHGIKALEFRHTTEVWWGLAHFAMNVYSIDGVYIDWYLVASDLENAWDEEANASIFLTRTPVTASYLIQYNQTAYSNITAAWNAGHLGYSLSYEADWNASSVNAFGVMARLLTFQNPDLGIEGDAGTIFNLMVALPFWVMTAILILLVIQSLVPFIRGVDA